MTSRRMTAKKATEALCCCAISVAAASSARAQISPIVRAVQPEQAYTTPNPRADMAVGRPSNEKPPIPSLAPFRLKAVHIVGSSLSPTLLRPAYERYIGSTVQMSDVSDITNRLATVYAARSGLALYTVTVPKQQLVLGVLEIEVTEGYVQSAEVRGPKARRDYRLLHRYAADLTAERPLRKSTLERYVSLIRDIPGLAPSLQFVPGSRPGALTLIITVKPKTVEVAGSINNRGTAYLGRTQVELDAALHSLLRDGDDTRLTIAAPTDGQRFRYYGISNAQPFGEGATAQISFGYLSTHPSYYDLHGRAVSLGLQVNAPLVRRFDQSLYVGLGLDGLNSSNALLGQTLSNDRTRAARASLSYKRQSSLYFLTASGSASFGLDALGARVLNPALSDARFKKLNLKLGLNVALPLNTILRLDSAAQYTSDRLPGAEQFALGGDEFGRAYEAAAVTGDRGVAGSAEFAWKLAKLVPASFSASEIYGFADGGKAETIVRPGLPSTTESLASIGGGGRLAIGRKAILQLEVARGLTNPLLAEDHESWRGIFSLKSLFW